MSRIKVIINTHRKPACAITTLMALKQQEGGRHDIDYIIGYDKEDFVSDQVFRRITLPCVYNVEPRPDSVTHVWNRNLVPDTADYYVVLPDDAICATSAWDDYIVGCMRNKNLYMMGWNDLANPGQLTLPIVDNRYLGALSDVGLPLLDPRFPYWFADTACGEVYTFATGKVITVGTDLIMAGPGCADRLVPREAWDVFVEDRHVRRMQGARIAESLGLIPDVQELNKFVLRCEARDERGRAQCE